MALTDGAARERIAAQDLAALRSAGVLDRGPAPRAAALLRRPVPRRARSDPRSAVLPHARGGPRPGRRQRRRAGPVRAPGGRGPIARHLAGPRRHAGGRARAPAARGRRVARQHSRGGTALGPVRPVASAAAADAQPHGPVRAGAAAGRVHRQSDRRLSRPASPASARSKTATSSKAPAIVLVPWSDDGATDALEARRGRAAHAIFVERQRARRVGERAAARDDRAAEQHRGVDRRADGAARAGRRSRRPAGARLLAAGAAARPLPAASDAPRRCRAAGGHARLPRRLALLGAALRRPPAARRDQPGGLHAELLSGGGRRRLLDRPGRRAARAGRGRARAAADRSHAARRSARLHRGRDPRAGAAQRVARGRRRA